MSEARPLAATGDPARPAAADGAAHRDLHDPDRRLDIAFAALGAAPASAFLHCLQPTASSALVPPLLRQRLPHGRWIPASSHPLTFVDPSDHLLVHQAWLEACHGPDRVAEVEVRTVLPLEAEDDGPLAPIGRVRAVLIDLIGVDGIDAIVVILTPSAETTAEPVAVAPPPRGAESFRLRFDLTGTIIDGSERVATLLGHDLTSLLGSSMLPLVHPDDLPQARETWYDVLAEPDRSQSVRVRLRRPDDTWRWFSSTAWVAFDDPDGQSILSEYHDIEALVEAEQALHASELGFRTLAESLPVGVAVLDQDGRVHFANHRLVSILLATGLAGPESASPTPIPVGAGFTTSWSQLVAPEFAERVADLVAPTGSPNGGADPPRSRQIGVVGPSGADVDLLIQAVSVWNQDGCSVIVSVQDVSEEVHTGRAHARLVQVVDEVDDVVIVTRLGGDVSYVNQSARRFLGADALGHPLRGYLRAELRDLIDDRIAPALQRDRAWRGDIEIADLSGQEFTMATTVSPVRDPNRPELHVGITMRDVTAERAHERELAWLARHDALTGLPNRLSLMERLEACRSVGDPADELAIFFIDLDNLKIVNDGVGHSAGDRLLVAVARELALATGDHQVARFGGDEFVVIAEHVAADDAMVHAEAFLDAVRSVRVDGVATHVSASIGVATARRGAMDPEALVRHADAAMYEAKRAGRARCARFDDGLQERVTRRFQMETALRRAIERDELTVHLQPVVSLADGATTGVEALCRWDLGSPGAFISVAEESGLIGPLGSQVLDKALRAAHLLRGSPHHASDLVVGINVSARELDRPDFAPQVLERIAHHGLHPSDVVLELTESVLIDQRSEIDASLSSLREAGLRLALDDFGSGYSSLTYLRRYPIDILKLDISYTQAMVEDVETRVIVESLVSMANRLGLDVVAEGIETVEQLRLAKDLGVRWAQGFLVGRPASLSSLLAEPTPVHPDLSSLT